MRKPKVLPMSAELKQMMAATAAFRKSRIVPTQRVEWYYVSVDSNGNPVTIRETNETFRQKRLLQRANRRLAAAGFFDKPEPEGFDNATHHDSITSHGGLRPTWQGRA